MTEWLLGLLPMSFRLIRSSYRQSANAHPPVELMLISMLDLRESCWINKRESLLIIIIRGSDVVPIDRLASGIKSMR